MRRQIQAVSKAPTGLILETAFTAALLCLASSGLKDVRNSRAGLNRWRTQLSASEDFRPKQSPPLPSLSGITADGRSAVFLTQPRNAPHYVIFVVHGASLGNDISFWMSVEQILPAKAGLRLVGYCDGLVCVGEFKGGSRPGAFPVIGYAEYRTARVLLRADASHLALVLNGDLEAIGSVGWTSTTPPAPIAAAILAATVKTP